MSEIRANYGQDCAATADSNINQRCANIANSIDKGDILLTRLESRLQSVTRPAPPCNPEKAVNSVEPTQSPLADSLRNYSDQMARLNGRLQLLLDQVEL